jgi:hypothetical protein
MKCGATAGSWFDTFFEKALVSRIFTPPLRRRIPGTLAALLRRQFLGAGLAALKPTAPAKRDSGRVFALLL